MMNKKKFKRSAKHSAKSVKREVKDNHSMIDFPSPADINRRVFEGFEDDTHNYKEITVTESHQPGRLSTSCFTMSRFESQILQQENKLNKRISENMPKTSRSITKLKDSLRKKISNLRRSNQIFRDEARIQELRCTGEGKLSIVTNGKSIETSESSRTIKESKTSKNEFKNIVKKLKRKIKDLSKEVKRLNKNIKENEDKKFNFGDGVKTFF